MKLPQGRATNGLAIATIACFLPFMLLGRVKDIALSAGFIPERWEGVQIVDSALPMVPAWLTPLTATLVHGGFMHLLFNMLMLVFCGRFVEQVIGPRLLLLLYVAGAYAAAVAEYFFSERGINPVIGASGAISAIIATYALLYSRQDVRRVGPLSPNLVRILWLGAAWTMLQIMIGLAAASGGFFGRIAVAAHIGGFLVGLVLTRPMLEWRFGRSRSPIDGI